MPHGYNGSLPEIKERLQKCDFCWRIVAALSGQKNEMELSGTERRDLEDQRAAHTYTFLSLTFESKSQVNSEAGV